MVTKSPEVAEELPPRFQSFTNGDTLDEIDQADVRSVGKTKIRVEFKKPHGKVYWVYRWQLKDAEGKSVTFMSNGKKRYKRGYKYGGEVAGLPKEYRERLREYANRSSNVG